MTLVAEETDDDDEIKYLQNVLTKMGAVVNIMKKEEDIGCVLMAQTARMLAFNLPMVRRRAISLQIVLHFPGFR